MSCLAIPGISPGRKFQMTATGQSFPQCPVSALTLAHEIIETPTWRCPHRTRTELVARPAPCCGAWIPPHDPFPIAPTFNTRPAAASANARPTDSALVS